MPLLKGYCRWWICSSYKPGSVFFVFFVAVVSVFSCSYYLPAFAVHICFKPRKSWWTAHCPVWMMWHFSSAWPYAPPISCLLCTVASNCKLLPNQSLQDGYFQKPSWGPPLPLDHYPFSCPCNMKPMSVISLLLLETTTLTDTYQHVHTQHLKYWNTTTNQANT